MRACGVTCSSRPTPRMVQSVTDRVGSRPSDRRIFASRTDHRANAGCAQNDHSGAVELRGTATLEEAFDRAMGAVMRRTDLTVHIADSKSVWAKFRVIIATVASALSITVTGLALPGDLRQAIDGAPAEQPLVVRVEIPPGGAIGSEVHHTEKVVEGHSAG